MKKNYLGKMNPFYKNAPQFITDKKGKKLSVVISIADYNKILKELEELQDILMYDSVKMKKEKSQPFTKYLQKRNGMHPRSE